MNTVLPPSYSPALAGETEEVEKGVNTGKGVVVLSADFPGGNVKICRLVPGVAEIEADLRDTPSPWFYWNFEARAKKAGTVKFLFPVDQMQISAQGPAVSTDGGRTWHFAGRIEPREESILEKQTSDTEKNGTAQKECEHGANEPGNFFMLSCSRKLRNNHLPGIGKAHGDKRHENQNITADGYSGKPLFADKTADYNHICHIVGCLKQTGKKERCCKREHGPGDISGC